MKHTWKRLERDIGRRFIGKPEGKEILGDPGIDR
jgi:hypothetical protein